MNSMHLCETQHGVGMLRSFFDPKALLLLLSLNYIGIVTASLGLLLFLPQIIKQLGVSNMQVGWVTMIHYIFGRHQHGRVRLDFRPRRRPALEAVQDLRDFGRRAGMTVGAWWSLVGIVIAAIGFYGAKGPFWSMPTMFLTGPVPPPRRGSPGSTRSAISADFFGRRSLAGHSS
jgi:MFS transporter, ACS family, tartrate transporter